jgi:drug/metabolite transporter (DMT)-like permease
VLRAGVDGALLTQARVTGAFAGLAAVLLAARPGVLRANLRQVAYLVAFALLGLNGVQLFYFLPIERLPIGIAVLIEYVAPVLVALYAALVCGTGSVAGWGFGVSAAFWAVVEPPWSFPWHRPDDQVAVGGALGEATLPRACWSPGWSCWGR